MNNDEYNQRLVDRGFYAREINALRDCLELCRSALEPIASKPDAPFNVVAAYASACEVLGKEEKCTE